MTEKVNVLLVDDQPDKLLAYEVILHELNENLVKTSSAREALQFLLKNDVAVVLIDVCMPELDGFQLAAMIREHPRFRETAIIFISAIHLTDVDRLRGYEMGAVDYVPVPVVPEVLRAKVKVFAELFRKTRELEQLNLNSSAASPNAPRSSKLRTCGSCKASRAAALRWRRARWARGTGTSRPIAAAWDEGQYRIFGVEPQNFQISTDNIRSLLHPDDWEPLRHVVAAHGQRRAHATGRIPRAPPQWRAALVHRHRGGERRRGRQRSADQRRHHRRHRAQGGRRAASAAGARGRSSRPQCARHHPIDHPADARQKRRRLCCGGRGPHQGAWRGRTRCCPIRAGTAPISARSSPRNSRPTAAATRSSSRDRTSRCSRRPHRASRWRCTSSPPMRPSTARCRRSRARSA